MGKNRKSSSAGGGNKRKGVVRVESCVSDIEGDSNGSDNPEKGKGSRNGTIRHVYTTNSDMDCIEEYLKPVYKDGEVILEVECGSNKAMMYLSKLCQGSKGPCVEFQGSWLTPNEFQYVSGRETAKDWKRSIRHQGKSMKLLLTKGVLSVHSTVCDCEGCRVTSPVNRCRLAEKRRSVYSANRKERLTIESFTSCGASSLDGISDILDKPSEENVAIPIQESGEIVPEKKISSKHCSPLRESRLSNIIEQLRTSKEREKSADTHAFKKDFYEDEKRTRDENGNEGEDDTDCELSEAKAVPDEDMEEEQKTLSPEKELPLSDVVKDVPEEPTVAKPEDKKLKPFKAEKVPAIMDDKCEEPEHALETQTETPAVSKEKNDETEKILMEENDDTIENERLDRVNVSPKPSPEERVPIVQTAPVKPVPAVQTVPVELAPAVKTAPVKPAPIKPVQTAPVKPVQTAPVKPAPVKPVQTAPVKPVQTAPVKPVQTASVKLVQTAPVKPIQTAPVESVQTAPVQHEPIVQTTSAEHAPIVQTAPVKPVQTAPVKPVQTAPVKPVQTAPVKLVQTAPVKPVQTAPVEHELIVQSKSVSPVMKSEEVKSKPTEPTCIASDIESRHANIESDKPSKPALCAKEVPKSPIVSTHSTIRKERRQEKESKSRCPSVKKSPAAAPTQSYSPAVPSCLTALPASVPEQLFGGDVNGAKYSDFIRLLAASHLGGHLPLLPERLMSENFQGFPMAPNFTGLPHPFPSYPYFPHPVHMKDNPHFQVPPMSMPPAFIPPYMYRPFGLFPHAFVDPSSQSLTPPLEVQKPPAKESPIVNTNRKRVSSSSDTDSVLDLSTKRSKFSEESAQIKDHYHSKKYNSKKSGTARLENGVLNLGKSSRVNDRHSINLSDTTSALEAMRRHALRPECSCQSLKKDDIRLWPVSEVVKFLQTLDGCYVYADTFREHRVDGKSLPLLTVEHLMHNIGMKLGPAVLLTKTVAKRLKLAKHAHKKCPKCDNAASDLLSLQNYKLMSGQIV